MTAHHFISLAVKMQRRATLADLRGDVKMALSYCRRRNYAADKARQLGARVFDVWSAIDAVNFLEAFPQREARS